MNLQVVGEGVVRVSCVVVLVKGLVGSLITTVVN